MTAAISVDRNHLRYRDGDHELVLSVEWSGMSKTDDCPIDFEVYAGELDTWTTPRDVPIDAARREQLLDEIAAYYSISPAADIIGKKGALLRGASAFRFSLQIHPVPSRYYEVGRLLAIPMLPTKGEREWHCKYVADFTNIANWTEPDVPLTKDHLLLIADRIVRTTHIGITGLPKP